MKAINWNDADPGVTLNTKMSAEMQDWLTNGTRTLIESAAEASEELMEKYGW